MSGVQIPPPLPNKFFKIKVTLLFEMKSCIFISLGIIDTLHIAGWSSPVARQAHNLKVVGSNPTPATKNNQDS